MATYSIQTIDKNSAGKTVVNATIVFSGDAYSTGVTVDRTKLGFRNALESLVVIDQGGGYAARFANGKLVFYYQDPGVPGATELSDAFGGTITLTVKVLAVGW